MEVSNGACMKPIHLQVLNKSLGLELYIQGSINEYQGVSDVRIKLATLKLVKTGKLAFRIFTYTVSTMGDTICLIW